MKKRLRSNAREYMLASYVILVPTTRSLAGQPRNVYRRRAPQEQY